MCEHQLRAVARQIVGPAVAIERRGGSHADQGGPSALMRDLEGSVSNVLRMGRGRLEEKGGVVVCGCEATAGRRG